MIYQEILNHKEKKSKKLALLIDPGKQDLESVVRTVKIAESSGTDYFFLGGSLVSAGIETTARIIRDNSNLPLILFPGSLLQLTDKADAILLLSLISGRNPDMLIGNHVIAAPYLRNTELEIIPTGYMLIGNSSHTSVEYMSNTRPIPSQKNEIAVATAIAGEMLGLKIIYLEAGSGAGSTVDPSMVHDVRNNISVPLIVGGGIKSAAQAKQMYESGADILVIGNAAEYSPDIVSDIASAKQ